RVRKLYPRRILGSLHCPHRAVLFQRIDKPAALYCDFRFSPISAMISLRLPAFECRKVSISGSVVGMLVMDTLSLIDATMPNGLNAMISLSARLSPFIAES